MDKFTEAIYTIGRVRATTDTAVLMYSAGGKDSIVLLDMLATRFPHVVCYYMYHIPDLDHIRPYLQWARRYGNVEIRQIPHHQVSMLLHGGVYCDPQPDVKELNERDVVEMIKAREHCQYVFNGTKGADGYMKLMRLKRHLKRSGWYEFEGLVYPLATWVNDDCLKYITSRRLISPFIYGYGKSKSQGFGLYKECFDFLMWEYPNDVAKALKVFPYASALLTDEQKTKLEALTDWKDFR